MNNTRPSKILDESKEDCVLALGNNTLMLKQLFQKFKDVLLPQGLQVLNENLMKSHIGAFTTNGELYGKGGVGVDCQILEPGKSWQKGKIRLKVVFEFYPDEPDEQQHPSSPESPLDDIRKCIN